MQSEIDVFMSEWQQLVEEPKLQVKRYAQLECLNVLTSLKDASTCS